MTLKEPIRAALLAEALRTVLRRCPYYQVHLRRGFFWYYLQRHDAVPPLHPMSEAPVSAIPAWRRDTDLFRVQARGATIAIDFSHILTDGIGGLRFLGTLLTRYLELRGVKVDDWAPFLDPSAPLLGRGVRGRAQPLLRSPRSPARAAFEGLPACRALRSIATASSPGGCR